MGLIFVMMLFLWDWLAAVLCVLAISSLFFYKNFRGAQPYLSLLYAFLIPGLGVAYLGFAKKGLAIYSIHYFLLAIMGFIGQVVSPEPGTAWVGALFLIPFFIQLYITAYYYKQKHGDIKNIWTGR